MSKFYLTIKKIVHILSFFSYGAIIIYLLLCFPVVFGYKPSVILTGSMEPTLKVGSVTYYKKVPKSEIKARDIITFKSSEGMIVTHRIYSISADEYITKGDANNTTDNEKLSYKNILGKNSYISVPYFGYFLYFLRRNIFAPLLLVAILIFEFLFNTLKFKKRRTTRKKDEDDVIEEKKTTKKKTTKKKTTSKGRTSTRKTSSK